jgi:monovalent cation:H+ antiporter-2, CPA2 family
MVGTMTIITSFLSPYVVKFEWRVGDRFKQEPAEQKVEEEGDEEEPRKEGER